MNEDRIVSLRRTGAVDDPLTEILRAGARRLIAQAVEAEFETFLAGIADLVLPDGRRRVVRHGHDPVLAIRTGIGPAMSGGERSHAASAGRGRKTPRFDEQQLVGGLERNWLHDSKMRRDHLAGLRGH